MILHQNDRSTYIDVIDRAFPKNKKISPLTYNLIRNVVSEKIGIQEAVFLKNILNTLFKDPSNMTYKDHFQYNHFKKCLIQLGVLNED